MFKVLFVKPIILSWIRFGVSWPDCISSASYSPWSILSKMFNDQKHKSDRLDVSQCSTVWSMLHCNFFLFTLHALLICSSHYMQLMSSSWTPACNFTRNITSTACNNMRVIPRILMYLRVRCMDTSWALRGRCV